MAIGVKDEDLVGVDILDTEEKDDLLLSPKSTNSSSATTPPRSTTPVVDMTPSDDEDNDTWVSPLTKEVQEMNDIMLQLKNSIKFTPLEVKS